MQIEDCCRLTMAPSDPVFVFAVKEMKSEFLIKVQFFSNICTAIRGVYRY